MHISGLILRCQDKGATALFYLRLGLTTHEHEHGGPRHFEVGPISPDFVAEIYKASERFPRDAIMVQVGSLAAALEVLKEMKVAPVSEVTVLPGYRFIYARDPDGRDVMIMEKV